MRFLLVLIFYMAHVGASSQDIPPVTNKIMINDVMITSNPAANPFFGDIIIDDGLITQVGSNLTAPFDAKVIEGDSMYVYAGFIAPASHIGLKSPEPLENTDVERRGYPPNNIAGVTPEKTIADYYNHKESSIKGFREQGFGIALALPEGMMMPGQGSIISLGGASLNESVIHEDAVMYAQWQTADVFPTTLIGIMSKWRELYRNSELTLQHAENYKSNPRNRKRPSQDVATQALWPVVSKDMPVFFKAEKLRDITRTLQLQKDLGFNLVITEAKDIDRILDNVKSAKAQVLLSLDLPDKMEDEKMDKDSTMTDLSEEKKSMEALRLRKSQAIDRYVGQAKSLSESNMPVSFSYLETKSKDVHTSIMRMIEGGLSKETALAALTTQAADMLGLSDVAGTLERGKLANMVMTTGPLWEEDTKIKRVLVDGIIHELDIKEKKKKKEGDEDVVLDLAGTWTYTIEIPGMMPKGTIIFEGSGDSYDVTVTSNQSPGEDAKGEDVDIDGSDVSFSFTMEAGPGMSITVDNSLQFDGDEFEGTVTVADFGSFEISGSKTSPE